MNKYLVVIPAALLLSLALTGCNNKKTEPAANGSAPAASASAPKGPVAKVNGKVIPRALEDLIVKEQLPPGTPITDDLRAKIKDHLVQREIILQAARAAKIDKRPETKAHQEFVANNELINLYIKDWLDHNKPSDADLKAFYDKKVAEAAAQNPGVEYKAAHILVESEDIAKTVIAKLQKGAKFADLAKSMSKDGGTREKGGELGWANPNSYAPEFAAALKTLEKDKFSTEPVKTQFGYHVILLEDSRKVDAPKPPKFEDVKPQLQQSLQQENMKKYIDDLKAKAKIE